MFPAILPWPMTLAPRNEAVRCENQAEKNLYKGKKLIGTIREVMKEVRTVFLSKKHKIFVRMGEELSELMVSCKYFA
jgi:hypothetical protein